MSNIPNYLSLITTIEQLFEHQPADSEQKAWLLYWAEKAALLEMQLNQQPVTQLLQTLLYNDRNQLQNILSKLANTLDDTRLLEKFSQDANRLYQHHSRANTELSSEQIRQLWQDSSNNCLQQSIDPDPLISTPRQSHDEASLATQVDVCALSDPSTHRIKQRQHDVRQEKFNYLDLLFDDER